MKRLAVIQTSKNVFVIREKVGDSFILFSKLSFNSFNSAMQHVKALRARLKSEGRLYPVSMRNASAYSVL